MSTRLSDGFENPAFNPDRDLVEELISVLNKHASRLKASNQYGSLLVAQRIVLHSLPVKPTPAHIGAICVMSNAYLMKPANVDEDPAFMIRRRM